MKILFDNQCFYLHGKGGISRYISNLISELRKIPDIEIIFQDNAIYNYFVKNTPYKKVQFKGLNRLNLELNKVKDYNFVRKHINKVDWYFPTYYDPKFLKFTTSTKTGLIIHDMIHELLPNEVVNAENVKKMKSDFIKTATKYFVVSNQTGSDLNSIFQNTINHTDTIYPGLAFSDVKSEIIPLPNKYALYVGNRKGYKNFNFILNKLFFNSIEHLVCVGGGQFNDYELKQIKELGIANQIIHLTPNQSQLKHIYTNAYFFISTSKYEGFGLPVLEAMEHNLPLVLWNSDIYKEVSQNSALYYQTIEELQTQIKNIDNFKISYNTNGYAWNKTAKKIIQSTS